MLDPFGRKVTYLRLSVTDRCNLRCLYCMPDDGVPWVEKKELLTYEEAVRTVSVLVQMGITKVRITGGEPLVRADLDLLVRRLSAMKEIKDLSLTTNAILLGRYLGKLVDAGLMRVNVSLDTLRPDRFLSISRRCTLDQVLDGMAAARSSGLNPLKINIVVMRGVNDDEIEDFALMTRDNNYIVRFIEMMPLKENLDRQNISFLPVDEVRRRIAKIGVLEPVEPSENGGPARYFRLKGSRGRIGFISPLSHSFCEGCNRIRLTATGGLKLCLFNEPELDIRGALRSGAADDDLKELIIHAINQKPLEHHLEVGKPGFATYTAMSQIGG